MGTANRDGHVTFTDGDWYDWALSLDGIHTISYHCTWRNADRTLRYQGDCVVCERRTWAADDGENDPRGVMGDHAADPLVAADYDMVGTTFPRCFRCADDYDTHVLAETAAMCVWREREPST